MGKHSKKERGTVYLPIQPVEPKPQTTARDFDDIREGRVGERDSLLRDKRNNIKK